MQANKDYTMSPPANPASMNGQVVMQFERRFVSGHRFSDAHDDLRTKRLQPL
jgi:hypothetical protein